MKQYAGLWFPDDGTLTKNLRARLDAESVYRGDRLTEALEQVTDFSCAVECGAHVGTWTRVLAERFRRVVSLEPDPLNFECLEANTVHLENVHRIRAAAGAKDGAAHLVHDKTRMGAQVAEAGIPVAMVAVDSLSLPHIGYLKVHVNGYEAQVLDGARGTIEASRPVLTVVFKPKLEGYGTDASALLAWIAGLGYVQGRGQDPYKVFVPA